MIRLLLTNLSPERFFDEHFHKAPYAEPGSARAAIPLLTWDRFAELIATPARPDMILSKDGKFLQGQEPKSIDAARALFESGCSMVLRNVEDFDETLREIGAAFGELLEGEVSIHTFATPGGSLGFGWHYDCEDVFLLQTAGTKEYLLRANTVNPFPTRDAMPRDMQFEREMSPVIATTLVAGDWLYIPRGWWHSARATDDSLSISVGVLSPDARGNAAPRARGASPYR